jgi:hypothetical protein
LELLDPSTLPLESKKSRRSDRLLSARSERPMTRPRRTDVLPSRRPLKRRKLLRLLLKLKLLQPPILRHKLRRPRPRRPSPLRVRVRVRARPRPKRSKTARQRRKREPPVARKAGNPSQGPPSPETGDLPPTLAVPRPAPEADVVVRAEDLAAKDEEDPVPTEHHLNRALLREQAKANLLVWTKTDGQLCRIRRDGRDVQWRNMEKDNPKSNEIVHSSHASPVSLSLYHVGFLFFPLFI